MLRANSDEMVLVSVNLSFCQRNRRARPDLFGIELEGVMGLQNLMG